MAGIAAAHQLAVRDGIERVVLIDEREPLSLTSTRGTEAYRNWWPGPGEEMVRLMNRSIDLLDALARESGNVFELNRRGYVYLSADLDEAARLRKSAREISSLGGGPLREHTDLRHYRAEESFDAHGADYLDDPQLILRLFPQVTPRVKAMLHARRAGWMNTKKLGNYLLERAVARGVEVVRDRVQNIALENGRFSSALLASGKRIDARVFVLAAGPLLPEWVDRIGLRIPIVDELHGKVAFEDDAGIIPRDTPMLIWNDPCDLGPLGMYAPGVHYRVRGERTVIGVWTWAPRVETPEFPPRFVPNYPDLMIRGLACMVPALARYRESAALDVAITDGGYYCKAPDNRPLIGPAPVEGVVLLGALSGFGVMASQAAAELAAHHVVGRKEPEWARAFRVERFDDPGYWDSQTTPVGSSPKAGRARLGEL